MANLVRVVSDDQLSAEWAIVRRGADCYTFVCESSRTALLLQGEYTGDASEG
jgi:hypothetical protein